MTKEPKISWSVWTNDPEYSWSQAGHGWTIWLTLVTLDVTRHLASTSTSHQSPAPPTWPILFLSTTVSPAPASSGRSGAHLSHLVTTHYNRRRRSSTATHWWTRTRTRRKVSLCYNIITVYIITTPHMYTALHSLTYGNSNGQGCTF